MTNQVHISSLTPAQEARIPEIRDKWMAIGLSTEPGDHKAAEEAVLGAYKVGGLPSPKAMIWFKTPVHGCMAAALLSDPSLVGSVRVPLGAEPPKGHANDQTWRAFVDVINDPTMRTFLEDKRSITTISSDRLEKIKQAARLQLNTACWGLHDAHWLGFYDFFGTVCDLQIVEQLQPLMTIAKNVGWWWPFTEAAVLTEKPTQLHRDDRGRLHNTTGPAVDYAGELKIYTVHGVAVTPDIIENPESITAERILNERNAEVARVMLDMMGMEKFVEQSAPTLLDEDETIFTDAVYGHDIPEYLEKLGLGTSERQVAIKRRLLSIPMPNDPDRTMVVAHVVCPSTGREYMLRVPPTQTTIKGAIAWTFSMAPEEYTPDIER